MSVETQIADALAQQGWSVVRGFLPAAAAQALAADLRQRLDAGELRPAGIGGGRRHAVRDDVRGDAISWLEPPGANAAQRAAFTAFEWLRLALNRDLQLGLFDLECHYACYAPGAFYRRHLDRLSGDDRRILSCILYLNAEWQPADGGALRLFAPSGPIEVPPRAGTLATFFSARFEHEVLPAQRERLSLTGWFRRSG